MAQAAPANRSYAVLYYILFAVLPLVYVDSLVDFTLIPRQLFASVVVTLLAGMAIGLGRTKNIFFPWAFWAALGLVVVQIVSIAAATNPVESWATISRYGLMLSFLGVTVFLIKRGKLTAEHLIKSVVCLGAITGAITLFEILRALGSGAFANDIYAVKGTFSHKNLLSSALMLALPFAGMGAVIFTKVWKRLSLALIFLILLEIFVLRTRGVWVAVFGASVLAAVAFFGFRKNAAEEMKFPIKKVGIAIGLALVLLVSLFSVEGIRENVGDRSNLEKRMVFWQNSWEMIQENPALGVGAGNWKINFPKYGLSGLDDSVLQGITHVQRPHNDFLWIWSESGFLGLLCFLGIFVFATLGLVKKLKDKPSKNQFAIVLFTLFGLAAYLIFSLTDFPLERTIHNLLLMSLIVLSVAHIESAEALKIRPRLILGALLIATVFSFAVSVYRWQGEKASTEVLAANAQRNAQRIVPAAEAAINGFYNMDPFANPLPYYSSIGKLFLKNPGGAWQDVEWALDLHPNNIIVLSQAGNVKKTQENWGEALEFYERATQISPRFEAVRMSQAEIFIQQKKFAEAMYALNQMQPTIQNQRYLNLLSQVLPGLVATKNQHGKYSEMIRKIEKRNPQRPQEFVQYYLQARNVPIR